jgi:hypothetical protein
MRHLAFLFLLGLLAGCPGPTLPAGTDAGRDAPTALPDAPGLDVSGALPDAPSGLDAPEADAGVDPDAGGFDAAAEDAGESDAPPYDAPEPLPSCPTFADAVTRGRTPLGTVTEASGLVESRLTPGVLWIHNDSGDSARVFAVDPAALVARATYTFSGVTARDWEDIAIGPGPIDGAPYLYVGDIGDNGESRSGIQVYRVREPASPSGAGSFSAIDRFDLVYPDRPHNAETLLVDPRTGEVFIVVKDGSGVSPVFRAAAPLATGVTITLEQVSELRFGAGMLPGDTTTTGGDISPSGDEILIRTYDSAYLWRRSSGVSVAEALATEPCRVPLATEGQGEAIGFATDGGGYFSTSEGSFVAISFYARR